MSVRVEVVVRVVGCLDGEQRMMIVESKGGRLVPHVIVDDGADDNAAELSSAGAVLDELVSRHRGEALDQVAELVAQHRGRA